MTARRVLLALEVLVIVGCLVAASLAGPQYPPPPRDGVTVATAPDASAVPYYPETKP